MVIYKYKYNLLENLKYLLTAEHKCMYVVETLILRILKNHTRK